MLHRLCVVPFTAAAVLLAALTLTERVVAQLPTGTSSASMVATQHHIFVLHNGMLLKFDQKTLALLGSVDLDAAAPDVAIAPDHPKIVFVEEPMEVEEVVEAEVVEEEEIVEDEPVRVLVPGVEKAVAMGMKWLVGHQDDDGKWDADAFMKHDVGGPPTDGAGNPTKDVGVTGLSLLALLGNGSTMRSGPHRDQVKAAAKWLRDQQNNNGLIGTNAAHDFIYGHAIATLALSEAYGLSNYKLLKPVAQKAINYLEMHRNPYAVWRYQPRDNDNDTSVTTWAVLAYTSGQFFDLEVNGNALKLAAAWYDQVTDESGKAGYTKRGEMSSRMPGDHSQRFPPEKGEALTAAALFARFLLDQDPKSKPIMKASADLLAAKVPQWKDGHIDPYYWLFGTQAMYQMGGRHWAAWSRGLKDVVKHQRKDGNFAGSWDPVGVWDIDGGRVYATAMYALALQVCHRDGKLKR